jgi:hypothetical protein
MLKRKGWNGWFRNHQSGIAWALVAVAVVTHAALVLYSTTPFAYEWDDYHTGVVWIYDHHRLPDPNVCWVCTHPPLFFLFLLAGVPFYALGMALSHHNGDLALRFLGLLPLSVRQPPSSTATERSACYANRGSF